ncbi:hypothetical protein FSP39_013777 [Pinctada imbricata]|uniref:Uncharacterized protein n=1 Tax=Pinctada imbricata TaxID=66713 RepID=A0AA88XME4_PINIB|nr:hypothetical protein FSP39_013777 [Pinctada imbricata]
MEEEATSQNNESNGMEKKTQEEIAKEDVDDSNVTEMNEKEDKIIKDEENMKTKTEMDEGICNKGIGDEEEQEESAGCMEAVVEDSTNEDDIQNEEETGSKDVIIENKEGMQDDTETGEENCKKEDESGDIQECVGTETAIEVVDEGLISTLCFVELQANTTNNLFNYIKVIEEDLLPTMRHTVESLQEQENNIDKEIESMEADIQDQCTKIASHMEETRKEMNVKIQEDKTKRQEFLAKKKLELEEMQKSTSELLDSCKEHMMKGGQRMMDFYDTKCPSLCNLMFKLKTYNATSAFERGVIDIPAIRREIGNLNLHSEKGYSYPLKTALYTLPRPEVLDVVPKIVGGFSTKITIGDIWCVSDNEAWITNEENSIIAKFSSKGEAIRIIDSVGNNECFVMDKDENFLVCSFWDKQVIKITPEGTISTYIPDLPCSPTCIAWNNEGDIVLCMKGYPSLCIYSADGKLKKAEFNIGDPSYKNADSFDVNPYRIIQNIFGDYIVVDTVWPYKVTSIDVKGKFRWRFQIDQEDREIGYPYNICLKGTQEFMLADIEYQRFHVLTMDGRLIRSIAFKNLGMEDAWAMCRDSKGRLWAGQDDGHIRILDLDY